MFALLTCACGPRPISDGGETFGESGTETSAECQAVEPPECDDQGRCWTTRPGWEADAQSITMAEIQEGVDAGTLTPEQDLPGCWAYGDVDVAHTCVVDLEDGCALLIGRPVQEVGLVISPTCDVEGGWSLAMIDTFSNCWGVFDGDVAVRLRLE